MPGIAAYQLIAPVGSTGNNTHTGVPVGQAVDRVGLNFVIEAIGATPTVTFKLQGALFLPRAEFAAGPTLPGANDWFDIMLLPSDSDTGAVTQTKTAVGAFASTIRLDRDLFTHARLVTTANTNVTYRAELWGAEQS